MWSFTASTATMLGLDVFLIPLFRLSGAALASGIGGAVGLVICLRLHSFSQLDLIPGQADIRLILRHLAEFIGRLRRPAASRQETT